MEKLTKIFYSRVREVQKSLESILDHSKWKPPTPVNTAFEESMDLELIENIRLALPEDKNERLTIVFSRLTSFFEGGLKLQLKKSEDGRETWQPIAAFHQGIYFPLSQGPLAEVISLPKMKIGELKKASPYHFLSPLKLVDLCDSADASGFAVKPCEDSLVLLFTKIPEPWLRTHIEVTYNVLISCQLD